MTSNDSMRLDVWLKLSCVFKQRSLATEACNAGHVKLNGQRAKPASPLKVGDDLEISGERERILKVLGLTDRSISKQLARELYEDRTPVAPKEPEAPSGIRERGAGRPTKRERREIEKWRS